MRLPCLAAALCLSLASSLALAGQPDPLWRAAREALLASRELVAGEVASETIVTDGDGKNLDTISKTTKLSGWRDGEPVRSTVRMTDTQQSGLGELKVEWGVHNHPEQALADGDSVRMGPAVLDGKAAVLFHVTGMQGKRPFTSKVWIDETTRLPLRADYLMKGMPAAKSMSYSVIFGRDDQARWLPLKVDVDGTFSALFYTIRIRSAQQLSNWVKRP